VDLTQILGYGTPLNGVPLAQCKTEFPITYRPFPLEDAILILKHLANQIPFLTLHNFASGSKHFASYKKF